MSTALSLRYIHTRHEGDGPTLACAIVGGVGHKFYLHLDFVYDRKLGREQQQPQTRTHKIETESVSSM